MNDNRAALAKEIEQYINDAAVPGAAKVRVVPKFSHQDVVQIRDRAIKRFVEYPYRSRLPGMIVDLTDDDKRALAFFEASVEILNSLGVLDRSKLEGVMPDVYTEVQEVISDQSYGLTFTQQKK